MNQWRNFTMARLKMISKILEQAAQLKTRDEKKAFLLQNNSKPLRNILKGAFDKTITFNLPKGEPPYRKDVPDYEQSNLYKLSPRFKYFNTGGVGEQMVAARREKMFIDMLEALPQEEAELVIAMKEKKLVGMYKGITKKLVNETWPTLIADGSVNSDSEEE